MVPIKFIDRQKDGIGPGSTGGEHGASLPLHYQLDQEARQEVRGSIRNQHLISMHLLKPLMLRMNLLLLMLLLMLLVRLVLVLIILMLMVVVLDL